MLAKPLTIFRDITSKFLFLERCKTYDYVCELIFYKSMDIVIDMMIVLSIQVKSCKFMCMCMYGCSHQFSEKIHGARAN